MPKMNRRRFLAALGATGAAAATYGFGVEPRRLEVTRHQIGTRSAATPQPLVLAQITDLHIHRVGREHRAIAAHLAEIRPHAILLTGDSVEDARDLPVLDEFLSLLDPHTPKYAIMGNWEHWGGADPDRMRAVYARHGGRLLLNETVVHTHAGRRLALTGLDDPRGGMPDLRRALHAAAPADARLLLAHSPAYRDRLNADAADAVVAGTRVARGVADEAARFVAMLSGHTHGGQVAPFGVALILPPGSGRYARGWFRDAGQVPLFVSRGIGESMLPVRLGSVPELAVHTVWV